MDIPPVDQLPHLQLSTRQSDQMNTHKYLSKPWQATMQIHPLSISSLLRMPTRQCTNVVFSTLGTNFLPPQNTTAHACKSRNMGINSTSTMPCIRTKHASFLVHISHGVFRAASTAQRRQNPTEALQRDNTPEALCHMPMIKLDQPPFRWGHAPQT